jgi:hypothetical protein
MGANALADPAADRTPEATAIAQAADPHGAVFRANSRGVLHIQSGMVCVLGAAQMALTKVELMPGAKPGDDVGCEYRLPTGLISTFATRLSGRNVKAVATDVFRDMKAAHPNGRPTASPMVATYPGLNEPIAGSLAFTENGTDLVTSAWVSEERGWLVEIRATYPATARHDSELQAAIESVSAQNAIHNYAGP